MKVTFCGANREVTGSCYLIETDQAKVVLDCGLFQGGKFAEDKNSSEFPFKAAEISAVVITHAHLDHTGRLPKLLKEGFSGKIWSTSPTAELTMITLRDAAHLMEDEAARHDHEPLYLKEDVEMLENLWTPVNYHQELEIAPGITVYLTDAGHILGSASVRFRADGREIVFSGDLGNSPVPLLNNLEYQPSADVVVMESTYGNRLHEPNNLRYSVLRDAILETAKNKGVLLIPAFAMERTQELIYELHHLVDQNLIPKLPVFLDSPMAINATEVFRAHLDYFNTEAKKEISQGQQIFQFPGLHFTENSQDSKDILEVDKPKIIIAGSGMMNGGRIMHHLKNYLGEANTNLLIIGYQVEGSLGRRLHNKEKVVQIFGQEIEVQAKIISSGAFSGHADYPRLMNWLNGFGAKQPRKVYVTHGELNSAISFSAAIEDQLGINSGVPEYGEVVEI